MPDTDSSSYLPLCAVCGHECTGRFWMLTLTDTAKTIYNLYFDTEDCCKAHADYQEGM